MKLKLPRLRWLLLILLLPPTLIGVVLGLAITWVNSPSGLDWLRRTIIQQASDPGRLEIGLEKLEGSLWSELRIEGLALADSEGVWLSLDQARLAWNPKALLRRELSISALEGGRLAVERAPTSSPQEDTAETYALPEIPLGVRVERLSLAEIALGAALAGHPTRLTLEGKLGAEGSGLLTSELDLSELDGALTLSLDARYGLADQRLALRLSASDDAGGLLGHLLGDPALPALSLDLEGDAPLAAWQGKIAASLEGMASLDGKIGLSLDPAMKAFYSGKLALPLLEDSPAAPFLGEESLVDLVLSLPDDETLDLERLSLKSEALEATLAGHLALTDLEGDFDLSAELQKVDRLEQLAPGLQASGLSLTAHQSGPLLRPKLSGEAKLSGLALEETVQIGDLALTYAAEPGEGQVWLFDLKAVGSEVELEAKPQVKELAAALLGAAPSLSAKGAYDLENDLLILERARLEGEAAKAEAEGKVDLAGELAGLDFTAELPALEPFSAIAGLALSGGLKLEGRASLPLDASSAKGNLKVTSERLDLSEPLATTLLGDPVLESGFDYGSGGLSLKDLRVRGKEVTLSGNPALGPDLETLSGEFSLTLFDLAVLEPQIGAAVSGEAMVEGSLSGTLSAPASRFKASLPGTTVEGQVSLAEGASLPEGQLRLLLDDPEPYAALTGLPGMKAKADLTLDLLAEGSEPAARLRGRITDLLLPEGIGFESATLDIRQSGALAEPRLEGEALLSSLSLEESARAGGLDLAFSAEPDQGGSWRFDLEAEGKELELEGDPQAGELLKALLGPTPKLSAKGAYDLDSELLSLEQAGLAGAGSKVSAAGSLDLKGETAAISFGAELADLGPLSEIAERPLSGALHLEGQASLPLDASAAKGSFKITSERLDLAEPLAAALLGNVELESEFAYGESGLALSGLALRGKEVSLSGNPNLGGDFETLSGDYRIDFPSLAALEPQIGAVITGEARIEGALSGSLSAPGSRFEATLPGLSAEGELALAEGAALPEGSLQLSLDDPEPYAALAGLPGIKGKAEAAVTIAGQQGRPSISGDAKVTGLEVEDGPSFAALDLTFSAEPAEEEAWALKISASGEDFSMAGNPALAELARGLAGANPRIAFSGIYDAGIDQLLVESAKVEGGQFTADAKGEVHPEKGEADLSVTLDLASLAPFSGLAGRPLSGTLHLEGEAVLPLDASGAKGSLALTSEGLDLGEPLAADLLGGLEATSRFDYGRDGLALENLDLRGKAVTLTGSPSLGPDFETLSGDYRIVVQDLTSLEPTTGLALSGEARMEGRLSGTLAAPASSFEASLPGARAEGELALAEGATLPQGKLRLTLEQPRAHAALAGLQGLEAEGWADVTLLTRGGKPAADLSGEVKALSLPDGSKLRKAAFEGSADDLLGTLPFQASLRAEGLRTADVNLSSLDARAGGDLTALTFEVTAEGETGFRGEDRPLSLALTGSARGLNAAKTNVSLDQGGELHLGDHQLQLAEAMEMTLERQALSLSAPALTLDEGQLSFDYQRKGREGSLEARFDDLPYSLADLATSNLPGGKVSGEISLTGGTIAQGSASLRATHLALSSDKDIPTLDTRLDARLDGKQLEAEISAKGPIREPLQATFTLPMTLDLVTPGITLPQNAPVSGRARWNSEVAPLAALFAPPNIKLTGAFSLDAQLSGSLSDPQLNGKARLENGTLEHLEQGTYLANLTLEADFDGGVLTISRFSADDSLGGDFSGKGRIDLEPDRGFPLDYGMDFRNLRVVTRDEATANVSGKVTAQGSLESMDLVARLTTDEVNISLTNDLPPEVVDLEPIPINQLSEGEEDQDAPPAIAHNIRLDIAVNIPRRFFVRGRGLSSEWQGDVYVKGTAARPALSGELTILRGDVELLARRFIFQEGTIRLPVRAGSPPVLDILAVHKRSDIEAQVRITGPADDIEIKITSIPALPEDEVLSRVLFNKAAGELTAVEALQLASAVAQLSGRGSGPGVLERARATLGVDVLRVDGGDGSSGTTIEAGRYLSDDIYVGIEQGSDANSSGVALEFEIDDNISLESKLRQSGSSNIGVIFEWDY